MTRYQCAACGRSLREVVYRDVQGCPIGPVCVTKLLPIERCILSAESLQLLNNAQKLNKKVSVKRCKIERVDVETMDLFDDYNQCAIAVA